MEIVLTKSADFESIVARETEQAPAAARLEGLAQVQQGLGMCPQHAWRDSDRAQPSQMNADSMVIDASTAATYNVHVCVRA